MKNLIKIIPLLFFLNSILFAQQDGLIQKFDTNKTHQVEIELFPNLESAIREGDINAISTYLGSQTYFSLSNGVNGYYSNNQAYYILEDFFKIYKVTSFRFTQVNKDKNSPYATGIYNYDNKGKRNSAQVYIALKKVGTNWKITQFTIN